MEKNENISFITFRSLVEPLNGTVNFWLQDTSHPWHISIPWYSATETCADVFASDSGRKEFLKLAATSWDLIVVDGCFAPCGMILAKLNGGPSAVFDTSKSCISVHNAKGTMLWWSLYPYMQGSVSLRSISSFQERLINFASLVLVHLKIKLVFKLIPYRVHFHDAGNIEDFYGSSLFGVSAMPFGLDFNVPRVQDVFRFQLHCPKYQPLLSEYVSFVDDRHSKGTIIIALGHYASWQNAPQRIFQALLTVFDNMTEYRFVWQYGVKSKVAVKFPKHIMTTSWLPQTALLNHPKTVLFISHMGLKSITEAICARVPVIALPLFAEQHVTTRLIVSKELGLHLDRHSMTADDVDFAIRQVLTDERYKRNVVRFYEMFTDHLNKNSDEVASKVEFFMRHKQEMHFVRQKGAQLKFFVLYGDDAVFVFLCILSLLSKDSGQSLN
ncbi:unnamed protein product [Soboliphyme baturini]|uniref:glucuronosyltransferase n=1 Tax=Soboliphyme baturini TaxID=241478 RepID=A0A183J5J7_9BILA|nr:unnamed protein product [Soboliphyme baturini]